MELKEVLPRLQSHIRPPSYHLQNLLENMATFLEATRAVSHVSAHIFGVLLQPFVASAYCRSFGR